MKSEDFALEDCFNSAGNYKKFMDYLSRATDCRTSLSTNCTDINQFKTLANNGFAGWIDDGQILLSDGTFIMFEKSGWVTVDINGYNTPPNKLGYDLFLFQAIDDEFLPMGDIRTKFNTKCTLPTPPNSGYECANRAKDDADYFKEAVKKIKLH